MKNNRTGAPTNTQLDMTASISYVMEGLVVDTNDPDQMGRLKVWVQALDGENFDIANLPWTEYASPLMGFTVDYPGGNGAKNNSHSAYGLWAIPKMGASVAVFCLSGDPAARYYFASFARLHRNRSFPAGRNEDFNGKTGPWGDAGDGEGNLEPIQPAFDNLRTQFQDDLEQSEAITRGAYERQAAQAIFEKDGKEGYSPNAADPSYLDCQTYCFVSPGRNSLIMQDHPEFARTRLKTAEGHQIILDDANERIYISTAKGKSWIEMDLDGHINVFGSESISVRTGKDLNLRADRDINLEAGRNFNVKAVEGHLKMSAESEIHFSSNSNMFVSVCGNLDVSSEKTIKMSALHNMDIRGQQSLALTGDAAVDIRAGESMKLSAGRIDLNGPRARNAIIASCATVAAPPEIVPGHEPWVRPVSRQTRGKNWKP